MSLVYNELMGLSLTVNERPRAFPVGKARGRALSIKLKHMRLLSTKEVYYLLNNVSIGKFI